jgi:Flp pilus assembly protein CpaB
MNRTSTLLRDLARAAGWHRRLLASVAAAAAVYFTVSALSPPPPETVGVLAAARDLPGGTAPSGRDLHTIRLPPDAVPAGAVRATAEVHGRVLAGPVRAGESLTDARFVTPGLVRRLGDDRVAYPVRIDDAEVAGLLRVGDRVDVLAAGSTSTTGTTGTAGTVAEAAGVIALPAPAESGRGALVVLAVPRAVAADIAQASVNDRLTLALTGDTG